MDLFKSCKILILKIIIGLQPFYILIQSTQLIFLVSDGYLIVIEIKTNSFKS